MRRIPALAKKQSRPKNTFSMRYLPNNTENYNIITFIILSTPCTSYSSNVFYFNLFLSVWSMLISAPALCSSHLEPFWVKRALSSSWSWRYSRSHCSLSTSSSCWRFSGWVTKHKQCSSVAVITWRCDVCHLWRNEVQNSIKIRLTLFQTRDAGGSMTIHTFGAYFGLMVTRILFRPNLDKSKHRNSSVYHSDLFAMIGKHLLMLLYFSV